MSRRRGVLVDTRRREKRRLRSLMSNRLTCNTLQHPAHGPWRRRRNRNSSCSSSSSAYKVTLDSNRHLHCLPCLLTMKMSEGAISDSPVCQTDGMCGNEHGDRWDVREGPGT
jgi:hypothetical protein